MVNENKSVNPVKTKLVNGEQLRFGYTTGTCAAAAATAAVRMLLSGQHVDCVRVLLPNEVEAFFNIDNISIEPQSVSCSVKKDAGDDPDVTDKIEIFAEVTYTDEENTVQIIGGKGVGTVTSKGLQCAVGEAAINPVPRKMIAQNVKAVLAEYSCKNGVCVKISALNGEEIAKKTFNPRLGIIGGISILGTTGIVEPMSEKALIDTIKVLIDKKKAEFKGNEVALITPGNYGRDYCKSKLHFDLDRGIKFSNFIGETLDYLVYRGFEKALLVGHAGKLIKLAGGIMNTHSSVADCRMEIIAAHAGINGATKEVMQSIMQSKITDEAIDILEQVNLSDAVFSSIMERIQFQIDYRTKGKMQVEVIMFSTGNKILAQSKNAEQMADLIASNKNN